MVWTGTKEGCTETQYIGIEDGVLYRDVLEQEYMTYGNMFTSYLYTINRTYDLFDVEEVDLNGYYSIDAYEDKGVSIEGDENMKPGDDVVLKAICEDGIEFDGWYNANGRFISSSSTLNLGRLVEDIEIHARGTAQFDTTFMVKSDGSSKHKLECNEKLTNVSWTLKHDDATVSGNSLYIDLNSIGVYSIIYSGTSQSGSTVLGEYNIVAGGDYSFSWTNDEIYYTVTLDIDPQDYIDCKTDPIQRYIGKGDGEHLTDFVTYESKYIKDLALQFETICEGMTDLERMNVVLSYTQNIPYMYDADSTGIEEYWKFALETILENNGDCEDTSILFCAIAKAMGYDTALMTLFADGRSNMDGEINHCVSLIKVDGCDGKDDFDGYCFCETTATGSSIGDVPWKSVTRTTIYAI